MAGSFFALFDDIASVLDDIATMTKVATRKTAGILGDDLAVNANQVSGLAAERELPVVWAVTKGSLLNKVILVPLALLLSAFFPAAIDYVLLIGGAYLCFEGAEKVWEWLFHRKEKAARQEERLAAVVADVDLLALEKEKIRGAIRTDFILSAEIVVIALGALTEMTQSFMELVFALSFIALLLTFGVYGLVALIVKMDDIGARWTQGEQGVLHTIGRGLLWVAPKILRSLSLIGTIAMLAVGGTIWAEHLPPLTAYLHPLIESIQHSIGGIGVYVFEILVGLIVGLIVLACVAPFHGKKKPAH